MSIDACFVYEPKLDNEVLKRLQNGRRLLREELLQRYAAFVSSIAKNTRYLGEDAEFSIGLIDFDGAMSAFASRPGPAE